MSQMVYQVGNNCSGCNGDEAMLNTATNCRENTDDKRYSKEVADRHFITYNEK